MKHVKNLYFCFKEIGTTLDYYVICNNEENNKTVLGQKEKEGYKIVKVV